MILAVIGPREKDESMIKEILYCDKCGQSIKEVTTDEEQNGIEYASVLWYGHKTIDLCKNCAHNMYFREPGPQEGEGYFYKKVL
jgi:uncharacterized protein with PIN domain